MAADEATSKHSSEGSPAPGIARTGTLDCVLLAGVIAVAIAIAGFMLAAYLRNPDLLWRGIYHDRNGHFNFGVDLALAIRSLDPIQFFSELEKARVWPPVHGLVLSAVLAIGGIDHRLGILPSLGGWAMTVVFVWLIVRRLFSDRMIGSFAAAVAVTLTAASPAFRLLAGDVMLEGLGAALSAFALWAYLRASPAPEVASRWRLLALVLTVLFFEKANYWGLVTVPILLSLALENVAHSIEQARASVRRIGTAAVGVWRDPLLILAAIAATAVAVLLKVGPTSIDLFGRDVSLYPPQNLLTVAYALLFARAFLTWRANRGAFDTALGVRGRMLFYWLVVPVAVSFLIPKRLYVFLWYVGPTHYAPVQTHSLADTIALYWNAFAEGFHAAPWAAGLVLALAALGAVQLRRLPPSARAVFLIGVVGATAVILHPQHQGRFLTSWIFAVWIAAGVGAGAVLLWLLAGRPARLRAAAAAAALAALVAGTVLQKPSPAAYVHAIHPTSGASDLDLVRPYLADLKGAHLVGLAATFGRSALFDWVIKEHCSCRVKIDAFEIAPTGSVADVREWMLEQVSRSQADVLVIVDAPGSRYSLPQVGWTYERTRAIVEAMMAQDRFAKVATYPIPSHGAEATIWRRRGLAAWQGTGG